MLELPRDRQLFSAFDFRTNSRSSSFTTSEPAHSHQPNSASEPNGVIAFHFPSEKQWWEEFSSKKVQDPLVNRGLGISGKHL